MDLTNLDKAYNEFEQYMRKVKRFPCPDKIYFGIWEHWKLDNGYEKNSTSKKNTPEG